MSIKLGIPLITGTDYYIAPLRLTVSTMRRWALRLGWGIFWISCPWGGFGITRWAGCTEPPQSPFRHRILNWRRERK